MVSNRDYDDSALNKNYHISINVRFDEKYESYSREVYSVLNWLSDIGGLQGTIITFGAVATHFFSKSMFMAHIVKQIYQVRRKIDEEEH